MAAENEPTESRADKTAAELEEVRASLVAQEHRFLRVLYNYWLYRHRPREDKLRGASASALLWGFLPSAATSSTGAVAALGLYLAYSANGLLAEQNELTKEQNAYLQRQIEIQTTEIYQSRKAALVGILYDKIEGAGGEDTNRHKHSRRTRAEGVVALVAIEKDRNTKIDLTEVDLSAVELNDVDLSGAILNRANLRGARLQRANLENARLSDAKLDNASLWDANLSGAILEGATLIGVNQSESTKWPDGFNPTEHGVLSTEHRAPSRRGQGHVKTIKTVGTLDDVLFFVKELRGEPTNAVMNGVVQNYRKYLHEDLVAAYKHDRAPTETDIERNLERLSLAHEKAASHQKRDVLCTAFLNSLQPEFYNNGLAEILWRQVESLEVLELAFLARITDKQGRWMPDRKDETDIAMRLQERGLLEIDRDRAGNTRFRPRGTAGKLAEFAFTRP